MKKEENRLPVAVHKATITLIANETIYDYARLIRESVDSFLRNQMSLDKKTDIWLVEIFPSKVVADVWKSEANGGGKTYYYSVKYTRTKEGVFSFSDVVEVERVTTFKPKKSPISVAKSNDESDESRSEEWVEKKNDMWSNIIKR